MGVNQKRMDEINQFLSKDNLEKYLKKYSANYIATKLFYPKFVTTAGTVIDRAKAFGVDTHSISSSRKLDNTQKLIVSNCRAKYGVDNVSQLEKIKQKKIDAAIKKYGVENVFQSEEIKEKSKQTCIKKYGVPNPGILSPRNSGRYSKFHKSISSLLEENNILHELEVYEKFRKNDYSPIVDILIEESKLVIECNGDFWHANPIKYKENDVFYTWEGKKKAKEIWEKDKKRIEQIESFGYKVLIVWDSEFKKDKGEVLQRIKNAIKSQQDKINQEVRV